MNLGALFPNLDGGNPVGAPAPAACGAGYGYGSWIWIVILIIIFFLWKSGYASKFLGYGGYPGYGYPGYGGCDRYHCC